MDNAMIICFLLNPATTIVVTAELTRGQLSAKQLASAEVF
jgi:hypothetical protein